MPSRKKEKKLRRIQRHDKKFVLSFDAEDRKDFLTGFRKRKLDRRVRAQEELEKIEKEERSKRKQQRNAQERELLEKDRARASELLGEDESDQDEHIGSDGDEGGSTAEYDCDDHVVSVTPLDLEISSLEKAISEGAPERKIKDGDDEKRDLLLLHQQKKLERERKKKLLKKVLSKKKKKGKKKKKKPKS